MQKIIKFVIKKIEAILKIEVVDKLYSLRYKVFELRSTNPKYGSSSTSTGDGVSLSSTIDIVKLSQLIEEFLVSELKVASSMS